MRNEKKRNSISRRRRRAGYIRVFVFFFVELCCVLCTIILLYSIIRGIREKEKTIHQDNTYILMETDDLYFTPEAKPNSPELGCDAEIMDFPIRNILLVNRENPLPPDYTVELVLLEDGVGKAAVEAYEPLCRMLRTGLDEGLSFEICSSYRDIKRQKELFEEDLEYMLSRGYSYEEAYAEVALETMPPGCSEHATGLAFDIVSTSYQLLDEGQEDTAENKWLRENCAEYGFILRYPRGKEEITGISYESWHFRYVGRDAALEIMDRGICLEEYLAGKSAL